MGSLSANKEIPRRQKTMCKDRQYEEWFPEHQIWRPSGEEILLGSILFIQYLNKLFHVESEGKIVNLVSFADDTALIYKTDSWPNLNEIAEQDFLKITKWFDSKLLTLK